MADLKILAEQLVGLTIKQANELFDILKNEYGIEPAAAAPVVMAGPAAASTEAVVEKTEFDLILKSAGASKLAVVKLFKEISGLPLKEAKELIDAAPTTIRSKLPKEEAESMKKKLEEAGAEVELK
ncbi:50S ribosomal protein L7/L12 [Cardinium endosymbiont of Culicoides punctatus]|uniref:50S ribosomal protein L7/L12 n=1 Tax=Cardinium endosymbiont of Culicoides punctatus TaxID=2304601 RepID=UPI001058AB70|nr:50S ribosomal protein L7/L12 [Cardinium endosymbiont of Culicoides punctatus]TDG95455.1 50S ribosomal protein L7/L12 [Cardinium endosymbiont of Culicoides punctatus]